MACDSGEPKTTGACPECNIVLISLDTLRADHVGAYGYSRDTTPNIDRLASRSVLFEQAISQSSWTRPAHMSMMTSLHPSEHGVLPLAGGTRLADDVPTLAGTLRDAGYTTVAFTGGLNVSAVFGFDRGFDLYRANGRHIRDNMEEVRWWLDRNGEKKFFMFLHGYEPHGPYVGDPIDRAAMGLNKRPNHRKFPRVCKRGGPKKAIQPFVDEYDGAVRRGDRYVGKFLDELDARGLTDKTIVLFTSDHGEEFLEHRECFHLKTLYREVLHVPLLVSSRGLRPRRVKELVPASVSIAPTILDLAGIEDHPLPGPSLASALMGEPPTFQEVVSETLRPPSKSRKRALLRAITTRTDKLIQYEVDDIENKSEYFRLDHDPYEQTVIGSGHDIDLLRTRLASWIDEHPEHTANTEPAEIPEDLSRDLEALGYLQ